MAPARLRLNRSLHGGSPHSLALRTKTAAPHLLSRMYHIPKVHFNTGLPSRSSKRSTDYGTGPPTPQKQASARQSSFSLASNEDCRAALAFQNVPPTKSPFQHWLAES